MLNVKTKFSIFIVILLIFVFFLWFFISASDKASQGSDIAAGTMNRPARGGADAKVVLEVYFDFLCPVCRETDATLTKIYQKYGDEIRIEPHYVPTKKSSILINASAECAQRQGKYWEYHDLLFANQEKLTNVSVLQDYAAQVKIDINEFNNCINSNQTVPAIEYDMNRATELKLQDVPHIFANGEEISWQRPENDIIRFLAE
ncbi:MAG: thioredoxin domain-containing protein [Patescibacteria group bacterium]|jgi:protein-disulfide isomerase